MNWKFSSNWQIDLTGRDQLLFYFNQITEHHELSHLPQRDNTNAFCNEVDKVMPDCLELKDWLKKVWGRVEFMDIKGIDFK